MIVGIGTDIIAISRIEWALEHHGQRFIERILSEEERVGIPGGKLLARYMAKRFAIKEAVSKALGTGFRQGVSWQDMVVSSNRLHAPDITLRGVAAERAAMMGADRVLISVSDEADYAVAFAIAETSAR